jgi:hypothetical protein
MWVENPHCRICGRLTVLPVQDKHAPQTPDTATLDHLFSRYDVRRYLYTTGPRYRLLCRECNNTRGVQETESIPKPEREHRSRIAMNAAAVIKGQS